MPEMTQSKIADIHASRNISFEENVKEELNALVASQGFWDADNMIESMHKWLYAQEIQHLETSRTWRLGMSLQSQNAMEQLTAMFDLMGIINNAADKGTDDHGIKNVFCMAATTICNYTGSCA